MLLIVVSDSKYEYSTSCSICSFVFDYYLTATALQIDACDQASNAQYRPVRYVVLRYRTTVYYTPYRYQLIDLANQ